MLLLKYKENKKRKKMIREYLQNAKINQKALSRAVDLELKKCSGCYEPTYIEDMEQVHDFDEHSLYCSSCAELEKEKA
jgi:hypothetical protein